MSIKLEVVVYGEGDPIRIYLDGRHVGQIEKMGERDSNANSWDTPYKFWPESDVAFSNQMLYQVNKALEAFNLRDSMSMPPLPEGLRKI